MSFLLLFITAFSLSMDAFAVSITNGLCYRKQPVPKIALASGLTFGLFQGFMPLLGYVAGSLFRNFVTQVDHWIALILLGLIGINMIREGIMERRSPETCDTSECTAKNLVLQGIATSIDALAVGISFAVMKVNIWVASALIALVTFTISFIGVFVGHKFGGFLKDKAQIVGGAILLLIGCRIFYQHAILGIA